MLNKRIETAILILFTLLLLNGCSQSIEGISESSVQSVEQVIESKDEPLREKSWEEASDLYSITDGNEGELQFESPQTAQSIIEYETLRKSVPYPGLIPLWSNHLAYSFFEVDETGKNLEYFLTCIGQLEEEATADELENDYILQAVLYRWVGSYHVDDPDDERYAPALEPIMRAVQGYNEDHYSIILKEHVEAAAKEMFGEDIAVQHRSFMFTDEVGWEWHETEGVYTPLHFGSDEPDWAHVFRYTDNGDSYEVEAVFFTTDQGHGEAQSDTQALEADREAVASALPHLLYVIIKNDDGTLTFDSMSYLTESMS